MHFCIVHDLTTSAPYIWLYHGRILSKPR